MTLTILNFDSIDSTNLEAKRCASSTLYEQRLVSGDHFCFVARHQNQGKGTDAKTWVSDEGGLFFTLLMQLPSFTFSDTESLVRGVGLCVVQSLKELTGLGDNDLYLEWPNDVILGYQKMGGILIETVSDASDLRPKAVIIGIGLNINQEQFPDTVRFLACSLRQKTGKTYDLEQLLSQLNKDLLQWLHGAYGALPASKQILSLTS